jgi:[ribosomal protein S18]-alanine N-acetyltransferase
MIGRALTTEDAESVRQLLSQSKNIPGVPEWTFQATEDSLRHYNGLGLEDEQGLAAVLLFRDVPGSREILHLATAERIRRKGWMEQLLGELISDQPPETELWLEVHENNLAARKLYEKVGFVEVGKRPRYYADGGTAVLYNLR